MARWTHRVSRLLTMLQAGRATAKLRGADTPEARHLARVRLAEILGRARGLAMKAGQLAATGDEADPLRPLVTSVTPLPLAEVRPVMERELGGVLEASFQALDECRAAASLGQVHHGVLHDGREVAVKVRYPGVEDAVQSELWLLGLMPGVGPVRKWGFDLRGYKRVLAENMQRELDYLGEASRQSAFARAVSVPGLVVPRVHEALCRQGLLVQSWERGVRLEEARQWPKRERLELARILLETLFCSLFRAGLVHGDPHPGNYLARPGTRETCAELVLLDYGCTISVPEAARTALLRLILFAREGGSCDFLSAFAALGFSPQKLVAIEDSLPSLCNALFRPFLGEGAFRASEWALSDAVNDACGELKWWFRSAGPPELLLLLRAFQGVCEQLTSLDVALPWWPLLKRAAGEQLMASARAFAPKPVAVFGRRRPPGQARFLRVRVTEGQSERANVALPASEALFIRKIVPDDVGRLIARKGVDLGALELRLRRTGLSPGLVFEGCEGDVGYRIWLE